MKLLSNGRKETQEQEKAENETVSEEMMRNGHKIMMNMGVSDEK